MRSKRSKVEALTIKSGPTESGVPASPVGGELIPVDKITLFFSNFWLLLLIILLVPAGLLLYKKRNLAMKFLTPIIFR